MIVFSRKVGEAIVIKVDGEFVVVRLLDIKGTTVRVGLVANKNVTIDTTHKTVNGGEDE